MAVKIESGCIGCGACVVECPVEAIELDGVAKVSEEECIECGACVDACPSGVIVLPSGSAEAEGSSQTGHQQAKDEVKKTESEKDNDNNAAEKPSHSPEPVQGNAQTAEKPKFLPEADKEHWKGVWVVIEYNQGKVAPVSWELLGEGRKLADDLGCELCGCLVGYNVDPVIPEAFAYGAEAVFVIDDPILKDYRTEPYTEAIVKLVRKYKPEILLMGATSIGRDVFPAVATELQTGLTADCTVLSIDPESKLLLQTRPAFGGNIMATIMCRKARPQMATVRPRVMAMPERNEGRTGVVVREELGLKEEDMLTQVLQVIPSEGRSAFLDKAEIIVAVGLGLGSGRHMPMIEELADVLGATVAGTRGAVENGWITHDRQVGQTGATVRPKVYIAIGISGAIQHLVGMETSDCIIAINNDPEAPIFRVANYGLVGDLFQIVPALTEEFRKRLQYGLAK